MMTDSIQMELTFPCTCIHTKYTEISVYWLNVTDRNLLYNALIFEI